jgi:hypothetical protein
MATAQASTMVPLGRAIHHVGRADGDMLPMLTVEARQRLNRSVEAGVPGQAGVHVTSVIHGCKVVGHGDATALKLVTFLVLVI